jgi:NADPH-dependent glutamate synthase beta subunit-like oxidoreductase
MLSVAYCDMESNFKLEKAIIDRRVLILEAEGIILKLM